MLDFCGCSNAILFSRSSDLLYMSELGLPATKLLPHRIVSSDLRHRAVR